MRTTPTSLRSAIALWSTAVAAGIAETILAVAGAVDNGAVGAGLWTNVGVRALVFATATLLILSLAHGHRWARAALALLLGVIGLASMVVPSVLALFEGVAPVRALGIEGPLGPAFVVVRLLHIGSVLAATVAMFLPSANRYVAHPSERTPSQRQTDVVDTPT